MIGGVLGRVEVRRSPKVGLMAETTTDGALVFFFCGSFFFFFRFISSLKAMNLEVLLFFFFNFINECLLFTIYFVVKCEFVIGFVLLFYLFIILRLGWIGPRIKSFRLGPEVVEQGLQGPNRASLGFKKKFIY